VPSGELERFRQTVGQLEEALDLANAEIVAKGVELAQKDKELASARDALHGMTARAGMLEKQADIEAEACRIAPPLLSPTVDWTAVASCETPAQR